MTAVVVAPLSESFWVRVDRTGDCWLWTGAKSKGYGLARFDGQVRRVYRVVYEALVGPIPEGLQIDHLCRVPACCNPAHLEPVTAAENARRAALATRPRAHPDDCPRGHRIVGANASWRRSSRNGGWLRTCKTCLRASRMNTDLRPRPTGERADAGRVRDSAAGDGGAAGFAPVSGGASSPP